MKLALSLTAAITAILVGIERLFGSDILFQIASGGIAIIAAIIAITFLWLWQVCATPLALGMAFSWAGGSATLAWWWFLAALGASTSLGGHPVLLSFVAIYTTGTVLHFWVIGPSLRWPGHFATAIPIVAFGLSALATWLA